MVRVMTMKDYDDVYALWCKIKGFAIRSIDDSRQGVERFLKRNPSTSVVAIEDGRVVGAILCGHDGRRGCLYHVCVDPDYRRQGIGKSMLKLGIEKVKEMGYKGILVEGDYHFYNKVGFITSSEYKIYPTSGYALTEPRCQMCMETYQGSLKDKAGYIIYDMYYNA